MWPLLLAAALPALIEQLGKTVRKVIEKREIQELADLKRRVADLEMKARWQ
jgi:hypothetical protein